MLNGPFDLKLADFYQCLLIFLCHFPRLPTRQFEYKTLVFSIFSIFSISYLLPANNFKISSPAPHLSHWLHSSQSSNLGASPLNISLHSVIRFFSQVFLPDRACSCRDLSGIDLKNKMPIYLVWNGSYINHVDSWGWISQMTIL